MYVILEGRPGRKPVSQRFSVAALEQQWAATYSDGVPVSDMQKMVRSLKLDLTALAFVTSGNDYLPGLRGYRLEVGGAGFFLCVFFLVFFPPFLCLQWD